MRYLTTLMIIIFIVSVQSPFCQTIKQEENYQVIPSNQSQPFMFTNLLGMYYYGETGSQNTSPYHGLSILTHKLFEDYMVEVDGQILIRSKAETHLYRDKLKRIYTNPELNEEITISDSLPVLTVKISSKSQFPISIFPLIPQTSRMQGYSKNWSSSEKILYITRKQQLVQNNKENYAGWIGISIFPDGEFSETNVDKIINKYKKANTKTFVPGEIVTYLDDNIYIFIIIANNKRDILKYRQQIFNDLNLKIEKKEIKVEGIRKV